MRFSTSPPRMKTREGETSGEPLMVSNSARGDARPPKTRVFTECAKGKAVSHAGPLSRACHRNPKRSTSCYYRRTARQQHFIRTPYKDPDKDE
jgi:hypothetical protein